MAARITGAVKQFAKAAAFLGACDVAAAAATTASPESRDKVYYGLAALGAVKSLMTPSPVPAKVPFGLPGAAAVLATCYVSLDLLDLPGYCHRSGIEAKGQEEVPLTGRLRLEMPPVTVYEQACRDAALQEKFFAGELARLNPGASYYPEDHEITLRAKALQEKFLAAAAALITEQYNSDHPVAVNFQEHFRGHVVPVRVYLGEGNMPGGFAAATGLAIDYHAIVHEELAGIMAHEVAHTVLRHDIESVRGELVAGLREAYCVEWSISSMFCGILLWAGFGAVPWQVLPALALWRSGSGTVRGDQQWPYTMLPHTFLPRRPQDEGKAPSFSEPLLHPGHPGFSTRSRSQKIWYEKEADALALKLLARAGYDPRVYIKARIPAVRGSGADNVHDALLAYALANASQLTVIDASDQCSIGPGGTVCPNLPKKAFNFAQALPAAMRIYTQEQQRQRG